jgi:hypothetical protein
MIFWVYKPVIVSILTDIVYLYTPIAEDRLPSMSEPREKPTSARGGSSRASSPDRVISRVISGRDLGDQYLGQDRGYEYSHGKQDNEEGSNDETSENADLPEHNEGTSEEKPEPEIDGDARDAGVATSQKDLEAGRLERGNMGGSKQSKTRDPNLVTWAGPEDPENPKNWPTTRKWAATLVGKNCLLPFLSISLR